MHRKSRVDPDTYYFISGPRGLTHGEVNLIEGLAEQFKMAPKDVVQALHEIAVKCLCGPPGPEDAVDDDEVKAMCNEDTNSVAVLLNRPRNLDLLDVLVIWTNQQDWIKHWSLHDPDLERRARWRLEYEAGEREMAVLIAKDEQRRGGVSLQ
jgi:hypothetical protein